jgi:hypothetical protein
VHAVTRMEGEPFAMIIGGEEKRVAHDGPRHSALYEIDGPHVLVSREWANAVKRDAGPARCDRSPATAGMGSTATLAAFIPWLDRDGRFGAADDGGCGTMDGAEDSIASPLSYQRGARTSRGAMPGSRSDSARTPTPTIETSPR